MKRQAISCEKICTNYIPNKELVYIKELDYTIISQNLIVKTQTVELENEQKTCIDSKSLTTTKMQIKNKMRYHTLI
jgi:hypothetical protein